MPITPQQAAEFEAVLARTRKAVVTTHMNPDGDAFGSALAMSFFLDRRGIDHEVVHHDGHTPFTLKFLPGVERIHQTWRDSEEPDVAIVLDLNNLDRIGMPQSEFIATVPTMVLIDHHVPHQSPGDLRLVDTSSPATCLILFELFKHIGAKITPEMATCLLTGIVTDTGSFRYGNTTTAAVEAAAELSELGADIVKISQESYMKKELASTLLLGTGLHKMHLEENGQLAWTVLDSPDFEGAGASEEHAEGLTNELLSINTVQIAAVIRQPPGRKLRASIRSREQYDVSAVARLFNGGGHKNAAGCTFTSSIQEAERDLIVELKKCLASSTSTSRKA
ncbi:MAG: bifunctional oligoribonuclease/PAP phosphatase NrnA [Chthonomonas sp.]|nr:bifunctional oligoribonuclease/PAP phosphatase NrnA [Chthonomonas sp.]